jgi:molybdopterin molybdotransferase/putative molybdopterin biosynthesis protein
MSDEIFLHDIPLEHAWERWLQSLEAAGLSGPLPGEQVALEEALGRVTAEPIWARQSSPHYHAAAMDGYALRADSTRGASDRTPIELPLGRQVAYVDTGDALPEWADAVIPIENVEPIGSGQRGQAGAIRLRAAVAPWSHVRPMGEDMVASELVLPSGHTLRPVDLGVLAGSGLEGVRVRRRPRVAILPTGSELVPPGNPAGPGQVIEYNSLVLAAQVREWGGAPTRLPIVPDDLAQISAAVRQAIAAGADLVLIGAGSSSGSEDFSATVVSSLGDLLVHGVAVRPGHPVILGMLRSEGRTVPVVGVPGYPVSAALTGEIFVQPLLDRWLGRVPPVPHEVEAVMTRKVHSSVGDEEFLRVTVGRVGPRLIAAPLARGAGVLTSLVRADGIVRIPAGAQGLEAGQPVRVRLYRRPDEIERTIVALGSHDLTLDLMAQFLAERGRRLTSANVGSLGGLIALRRGEAHFAGSHLLDPETGGYNLRYVREYLPDTPVVVIGLVGREQGLIVAPGNPLGLQRLEDVARSGASFVNRQRGAGTRVLLDYHLARSGIKPEAIRGYEQEEYTHLAVAAAIASGRGECGLGIRAAADALGLDFVRLFDERYDLIIPQAHYDSTFLRPLLDLLLDPRFRDAVAALPGYSLGPMGKQISEG